MGAEAIKKPEIKRVQEAFAVSEKTLQAVNNVVDDVVKDGLVSAPHEKKLADAIAKDFEKEGLKLSPDGEKKWEQEVHDIISPKEPPKSDPKEKKEVEVDPFDFKRLSSTLKDLDKTYGQEKAGWNTIAKIFGIDDGLRNITDGAWGAFFNLNEGKISHSAWDKAKDVYFSGFNREKMQQVLPKLALETSLVWLPFVLKYPMSILRDRAAIMFDKAYAGLQDKVNKRVSDSVVMGNFTQYQDIPASEVLSIVERGKKATLEFYKTMHLEMYPLLADMATYPTTLVGRGAVDFALGAVKIKPLVDMSKRQAKVLLADNRREIEQWNKVNAKVLTTLSNIENIQTSPAMDTASQKLSEQMEMKDVIRSGGMRQGMLEEEPEQKLFKWLNIGVPAAEQIFWFVKKFTGKDNKFDRDEALAEKVVNWFNDPAHPASTIVRDGRLLEGTLRDVIGSKEFEEYVPSVDILNSPFNAENTKSLAMLRAYMNPLKGVFTEAGLSIARFQDSKRVQEGIEAKFGQLTGLYVNKILPLLDDIQKMEDLLGPYDKLDRPEGPKEAKRIPVSEVKDFSLSVSGLNYKNILTDVSVDIPQGTFVTIKGTSGIGKTTFMRSLLNLYDLPEDTVKIGGIPLENIKKYGDESLFTKIGYANQDVKFFESLTLRENLTQWVRRDVPDQEVRQTLSDLNLDHLAERLDSENKHLSGGERVRIGIARALLQNPSILFLDEPTASLDERSAQQVIDIISSLRKKRPEMTVIAITHDPQFEKIAEQMIDFSELNKKNERVQTLGNHQILEAIAKP